MNTGTKCDVCGLNVSVSSKLLEPSKHDGIMSSVLILKESGQIPEEIKPIRNSELGVSVDYCAINDKSYGLSSKCKYWQLNSGQNTSEYISIHQSKTNLLLAKVAIGVSFASLIVALMSMGQCQSATKATATKDYIIRVKKESPKNPPNKTTNPVVPNSVRIKPVEMPKRSPEKAVADTH